MANVLKTLLNRGYDYIRGSKKPKHPPPNSAAVDYKDKMAAKATSALESSEKNAAARVGQVQGQNAQMLAGQDAATAGGLQERRYEAARAVAASQGRGARVSAGAAADTSLAAGAASAGFLGEQEKLRSQLQMAGQNRMFEAQREADGQKLASAEGMMQIGSKESRFARAEAIAEAILTSATDDAPYFGGEQYIDAQLSKAIAESEDPEVVAALQRRL